jgi:hypothetical protein
MHRIPMSMFNKGGIVLIVVNKGHDNQLRQFKLRLVRNIINVEIQFLKDLLNVPTTW